MRSAKESYTAAVTGLWQATHGTYRLTEGVADQTLHGLEMSPLLEDLDTASIEQIVTEAAAGARHARMLGNRTAQQSTQWQWIVPAPVLIKIRLFCLPYAGGISENVFGRCFLLHVPAIGLKE